ncbi:hypothetical protein N431DRAFT_528643 [Stipitochalara longipes BDJ]|nr:hypothetical protein N431DRAFT_528643 [Stipitochalara longipes BDJ]
MFCFSDNFSIPLLPHNKQYLVLEVNIPPSESKMPITVSSVGDIISLCLLVKDLIAALDEARSSVADYQEIRRELWALERTLQEVDLISRTEINTPEINALFETVRQAAKNCRRCVETFVERIRGYTSFEEGRTSKEGLKDIVKHASRKIGWMAFHKDAVMKFRAEIGAHSGLINILLNMATLCYQLESVTLANRTTNDEQQAALHRIEQRLEANTTQTASIKSIALGSELKTMMGRIMSMHTITFNTLMKIQSSLPSYLERSLDQEPWILEDAIGRISPIHFQFIETWEAFETVLEMRFHGVQGHQKVREKRYALQTRGANQDIDRSKSFKTAFVGGRRYEMSVLFDAQQASSYGSSCTVCLTASDDSSDLEIKWFVIQLSLMKFAKRL